MTQLLNEPTLENSLRHTRNELLRLREPAQIWRGELSASALSTATAVVALSLVKQRTPASNPRFGPLIDRGVAWLVANANRDGGWGDTIQSGSNISTTALVWAALGFAANTTNVEHANASLAAEKWLNERVGPLTPENLARKIVERYGTDRTFSVPILTHCALAGRLGTGREAWRHVIPLPFELAAFPRNWFAALRLPVVSYALPALIAIGYARHWHAPSKNPFARALRSSVTNRVLRVLNEIQPPNGGFLEAIPLTSFVVMSLAGSGLSDHPVARRGLEFIVNSAQSDGSWRIDTNLTTWVTTLAVNALTSGGDFAWSEPERETIRKWLLKQQYRARHPYTNAPPGGWAWTDLPGGVPDADDTAGSILALKLLGPPDSAARQAAADGIGWLLDLQNRDGGIPTFCRGWGQLPFDRSSADLTAHALRAWTAWRAELPVSLQPRITKAIEHAVKFLRQTQESDGAWRPLWFGNEFEPDESNRVYGTSRVLLALADTGLAPDNARAATGWLRRAQKPDGGWSGGMTDATSSVEETALAVESLSAALERDPVCRAELEPVIRRGVRWLQGQIESRNWTAATPIGFYFAKLWYYEKLYPVIFTVAALGRARRSL